MDTNAIMQNLIDKKSEIEDAKRELAQSEGMIEGLFNQLKKDFGIDSLEGLEKKITELGIKKSRLEKSIDSDYNKLLENWDKD